MSKDDTDDNKKTPTKYCFNPNESDSNDSEWDLEIVIKSTPKKRKTKSIDPKDQKIIDEFEKDIEETLEEKAAKSNLSHNTVKSILKHVFTDEHVLALVKQKEGCEDVEGIIPYEPKITRSKAKELYSQTGSVIPLPWQASAPTSEVQALLTQDLQEDSSGDEYVPGEEESEDDSFLGSVSNPPTPVLPFETPNHSFNNDEIFKTPQSKHKKNRKNEKEDKKEDANIALRTRSKLSLSQTPLEKIEQAFIPPDITTDMYEMDCKDADWKEFLKSFTQPLEEVVKGAEDEDHDPEYNILMDEEINEVDKEELRADKAVKVPRKELNDLMAELFEYVDIYSKDANKDQSEFEATLDTTCSIQQQIDRCIEILDATTSSQASPFKVCQSVHEEQEDNIEVKKEKDPEKLCLNNLFSPSQLLLLDQQMRQHVQILIQNFLLTYQHPFYDDLACIMKEYLFNLKFLSEGKDKSAFKCTNLEDALELVEKWEKLFMDNEEEAMETKKHYWSVMEESLDLNSRGEHYHLPFPPLVLRTIADSDTFIYPYLLPQIPFKHPELGKNNHSPFSASEYQLIALGLEQFVPHFMHDKEFLTRKKQLNMKKVSEIISFFMMPGRRPQQIYKQMLDKQKKIHLPNPIAYYNMHKKAPLTFHQVNPLIHFKVVPPRKRPPELLPRQWRHYIWPTTAKTNTNDQPEQRYTPNPALIFNQPKKEDPPCVRRKLLPKAKKSTLSDNKHNDLLQQLRTERFLKFFKNNKEKILLSLKRKFIKCFRATISYSQYYSLRKRIECSDEIPEIEENEPTLSVKEEVEDLNMLPSMPCLNLSDKSLMRERDENSEGDGQIEPKVEAIDIAEEWRDNLIDCKPTDIKCINKFESNKENEDKNLNSDLTEISDTDKDDAVEINALMVASSTVRNVKEKKEISSLADKKRAKKRKEYLASLAMLAPPDPAIEKDRREQFAQAYFEKLKETLEISDYVKVRDLFQNTDEKTGNAVDLYKKLKPILSPTYQDLADEFLLFLNAEQANAVGKLIPFFIMNHMAKFLRNLEIYFKDQPSQLRKIHRSLLDLNDGANVTLEKIKSTILPLLKGNPLLCDGFLQIFLEESPTATLLNGAWEIIDINKELNKPDDEAAFESIAVSDSEDSACTCSCHKVDEQQHLKQHCLNCGLRFVQGKIYCQTAKGLKPVNVTFPFDPDIDHNARLGAKHKIKRIDHSPTKRSSPSKESHDENKIFIEIEEDEKRKNVKGCRSPKKTKPKPKKLSVISKDKDSASKSLKRESPKKNEKSPCIKASPSRRNRTKSVKTADSLDKDVVKTENKVDSELIAKPGTSSGQVKRLADDIEWKNLPSPEYVDVQSSESDFSQDDLIDTNSIKKEIQDEASCDMWTRDEDKIILETFQQKFDQEAITLIAKRLKNRNVNEIRTRFERLMALLQEMEIS